MLHMADGSLARIVGAGKAILEKLLWGTPEEFSPASLKVLVPFAERQGFRMGRYGEVEQLLGTDALYGAGLRRHIEKLRTEDVYKNPDTGKFFYPDTNVAGWWKRIPSGFEPFSDPDFLRTAESISTSGQRHTQREAASRGLGDWRLPAALSGDVTEVSSYIRAMQSETFGLLPLVDLGSYPSRVHTTNIGGPLSGAYALHGFPPDYIGTAESDRPKIGRETDITWLSSTSGDRVPLPPCPDDGEWNYCSGTVTKDVLDEGGKFIGKTTYDGEWAYDYHHGQGTFTWADGEKYVGKYRFGLHHGQGTLTFADGTNYVGEFRDGDLNGQGTYTWTDGGNYVGEFRDSERNGQGTLYAANGTVLKEGLWENGKLVTSFSVAEAPPPPPIDTAVWRHETAHRGLWVLKYLYDFNLPRLDSNFRLPNGLHRVDRTWLERVSRDSDAGLLPPPTRNEERQKDYTGDSEQFNNEVWVRLLEYSRYHDPNPISKQNTAAWWNQNIADALGIEGGTDENGKTISPYAAYLARLKTPPADTERYERDRLFLSIEEALERRDIQEVLRSIVEAATQAQIARGFSKDDYNGR